MTVYEFAFGLLGLQIASLAYYKRIDYCDPNKGCVQPRACFYYSCPRRRVEDWSPFYFLFWGVGGDCPITHGSLNNIILLTLAGE